jgi:hypothetical protein
MVAAFAEENKLATIVVTKAPSRLLSAGAFKVGYGYVLGLQVAGYLTELSREVLRKSEGTNWRKRSRSSELAVRLDIEF